MRIIITVGTPVDSSLYLREILHVFGLCGAERMSTQDALRIANPATDLLIMPPGSDRSTLDDFLQAGGNAIAIRPDDDVVGMAGLHCTVEEDKPARLRIVQPICSGARGEPLWTLGPRNVYEPMPPENVLAYLFEPGNPNSESIGIARCAIGAGSLTIFAYDPATCMKQLRQGLPARANFTPEDLIPRSVHLHQPDAPQDTGWRPTADLHALAFCEVVKGLLATHAPVPTLWHIPNGKPAIVIFSGDEDGAPQEDNRHEMDDVEAYGGSMSLSVIPGETSITREHIADYTRRGHTISVHPDLLSTRGKSPAEQLAKAEADVLSFKEQFGQPVRTVRNHCTMWPGYLDLPELWEQLGIGMDANCFASRYLQSPDWGPYANVDAAIPLPFVREDGSLIDVYQQPTQINDDVTSEPTVGYSQKFSAEQFEWIARRIVEDAVRFFHAPLCVNFHPWSYRRYSTRQGQTIMRLANEFGIPIWSLDRWHDFWRARATWRVQDFKWDGECLSYTLTGKPCEGLSSTLPLTFRNRHLSTLTLNSDNTPFQTVEQFQYPVAQAALPDGVEVVKIVAEYSGRSD